MSRQLGVSLVLLALGSCVSAPEPEPVVVEESAPDRIREPTVSPQMESAGPAPESMFGFVPPPEVQVSALEECEAAGAADLGYQCIEVFYGTNRRLLTEEDARRKDGFFARLSRFFGAKSVAFDKGEIFGRVIDMDKQCEPNSDLFSASLTSSETCHLGVIAVSIPLSRDQALARGDSSIQMASAGAGLSAKELAEKLAILGHNPLDPDSFISRIADQLRADQRTRGHAIVYVHGFNVPFRNAAFRAAQIKYDTGFDGPVMFFSWPANQSAFDYLNDQADADLSVDALVRFLNLAHEAVAIGPDGESTGNKVHIIAHSMGTRVTAQALSRIADHRRDETMFGELIFAAGDLDQNLFTEWIGSSTHIVDGVTLYASNVDGAVQLSTVLRNLSNPFGTAADPKFRIGFFEEKTGPSTFPAIYDPRPSFRVDTIDITPLSDQTSFGWLDMASWFVDNHATYAKKTDVLDDMIKLICLNETRPDPEVRAMLEVDRINDHWLARPGDRDASRVVRPGCTPFLSADASES